VSHEGLLRILAAVLASAIGAWAAVSLKRISHFALCILISFAAGALLAVSAIEIIPEVVQAVGWPQAIASIASGYLLFLLITRFIFHICPACAATHTEANFKAVTGAMVVALSIHSFMDGLAISSGFLGHTSVGFLIFLAVAYHKFPEGMALTLIARGSGIGRLNAFLLTLALEGITTVLGGYAGLLPWMPHAGGWIALILGHVAGGFLFLVFHALLSEAIKHHPRSTLLAVSAGIGSILLASHLFGG
jgi:zinc transporter ZupT